MNGSTPMELFHELKIKPQRTLRIAQRTQSVTNQRYILRVLRAYLESFVVNETAP